MTSNLLLTLGGSLREGFESVVQSRFKKSPYGDEAWSLHGVNNMTWLSATTGSEHFQSSLPIYPI